MAQLMNRVEPIPGITSAGQPDQAALEAIAKEGFVAVIDLRGAEENRGLDEKTVVESLGMRYVSLPIATTDAMTYATANSLDAILAEIDGPVLLHCASGNRVGGVLALRERLNGASADEAYALGLAGGMTSEGVKDVVREQLDER